MKRTDKLTYITIVLYTTGAAFLFLYPFHPHGIALIVGAVFIVLGCVLQTVINY